MREKIGSLSFNYVILGVILLITAVLVIGAVTGQIGSFTDWLEGEEEDSIHSLAKTHCLQHKRELCDLSHISGDSWAGNATYEDKTCKEWIENEGILAGTVKECGDSY